jgi:hypothetical protein
MPKVKMCKIGSKAGKQTQMRVGELMKNFIQPGRDSQDFSNIDITFNKYKSLLAGVKDFLLEFFKLLHLVKDEDLQARIGLYNKRLREEYRHFTEFNIDQYENTLDLQSLPTEELYKLRNKYFDLCESFIIYTPMTIAKNILACKLDGSSIRKLGSERYEEFRDAAFKGNIELNIFNRIVVGEKKVRIDYDFCCIFSNSNISQKYKEETKREIFLNIISLCETGKHISRCLASADIDISQIFPKIIELMEMFKAKAHGCEAAFDIIKQSSDLFEKNFTKYFKKVQQDKNPMHLFIDFVNDIITDQMKDKEEGSGKLNLVFQLRKITKEFRKMIHQIVRTEGNDKIPENIHFIIETAESFIDEYELDTGGNIPTQEELKERQKKFKDVFVI